MELVERGADINACDGFSTPLINVCIQENAMFARKLIRLGADVNQKGNRTPLTATCSNGNLEVFNELIKEGADVNLPDNECYPLEAACIGGNLDIVSKIIALGVDVNVKYKKQTPLALACKNGHFSIVEELIKARADVNLKDLKETPLTAACDSKHPMIELERMIDQFRGLCRDIKCTADYYSGHLSVIEKLSRSDVNIYLTDEDKTDSSCCSTYQNIVLALVKAGADVNLSDGTKTPLTAACRNGRLGIVEELIRAGADVNQSDGNNTPLTSVCCCEPLFVEKSIKKWRDVNLSNDDKVIIEAKRNEERLRIIKDLLKAGANVNLGGGPRTGDVSLEITVNHEKADGFIKVWKDWGSAAELDIEKEDDSLRYKRQTPLTAACDWGVLRVVEELINAGANVNLQYQDETPLTRACYQGKVNVVKKLIDSGANLNQRGGDESPLFIACKEGHLMVVKMLLKAGSYVDPREIGKTPLIAACDSKHILAADELYKLQNNARQIIVTSEYFCEHLTVAEELFETPVSLQHVDTNAPLSASCCSTYQNIVLALIEAGAIVNLSDGTKTPLTAACRNGRLGIVEELIRAGADVNQSDGTKTPLTAVCCSDPLLDKNNLITGQHIFFDDRYKTWINNVRSKVRKEIVLELLKARADVNLGENDAPTVEKKRRDLTLVEKLTNDELGVNIQYKGQTPLIAACDSGYRSVVKELIEAGAKVNWKYKNETPLTLACYRNHVSVVDELLKSGADINLSNGKKTPLIIACEEGHLETINQLMDARADVNLRENEQTPLIAACDSKHLSAVDEMFNNRSTYYVRRLRASTLGISMKAKCFQNIPLKAEYFSEHLTVVEKLRVLGFRVNVNHGDEQSPLFSCCMRQQKIVLALMKAGADVNFSDGTKTPLTAACRNGRLGIVEELIRAGADVNQSDGNKTPLTTCFCSDPLSAEESYKNWSDDNLNDEDKLLLAARRSNVRLEIVKKLLKAGAETN